MILPERVYLGYLASMWWITAFPTIWVDTPVVPHVLPGVWFSNSIAAISLLYGYGGVMSAACVLYTLLLY